MTDNKQYPPLPDTEEVEQYIYRASRRYIPKDVLELIHNLMRAYVDADRAMRAAQAAPAYVNSTPELHVGDSAFEDWYSGYNPAHKGDKQRARDAYAAGMGDPLVVAAPAPATQGDALDAARYRWLAAYCRSTAEHWGGRWSIIVEGPAPKSHNSEDDFDAAIDAARGAQGESNG